jgi:hypothetical protein
LVLRSPSGLHYRIGICLFNQLTPEGKVGGGYRSSSLCIGALPFSYRVARCARASVAFQND